MNYSIGIFSNITNISPSALRYYEKEQLILVHRDSTGRRFFTDDDIDWILFIKKLKYTGMSIKDTQAYAFLRYQGDSTIQQRLEILENPKLAVEKEKEKWESNLNNLNDKIEIYKNKLKM